MATQGAPQDNLQITEDEAAVYDRQIRLWGLEAQQRMRNANILIVGLNGTATETIKNIVLAGVGKVVVVDGENVSERDLAAGFFFRDEDVGKKRVHSAKARIENLNPLVKVETIAQWDVLENESLPEIVQSVDLVCVTDWSRANLLRVNNVCRRHERLFYAGGTFGLLGYIFCDLADHEFISPNRSVAKDPQKDIRMKVTYPSLSVALQARWSGLTKRQTKELNPGVVFTILALWEFESRHGGSLPDSTDNVTELQSIADDLVQAAEVNRQVLTVVPNDLIQTMCTTARHEFSPVCAVVGGMLAQDILKALAAREPPIANFFAFDGNTGGATVTRMNMPC